MMTNRRAFTLIEVLMAFAAGSMLIGVIYFFHFGLVKTFGRAADKFDLNGQAVACMEMITRDLRMTYHVNELKPNHLVLQRLPGEAITSWDGFTPDRLRLTSVEYLLKKEGNHAQMIRSQGPGDRGRQVLDVTDVKTEIFTGYVLDLPKDRNDQFPKFHVFDTVTHASSETPRITLIRIQLSLSTPTEKIELISKVFLPIAHNNVLQADWNIE